MTVPSEDSDQPVRTCHFVGFCHEAAQISCFPDES